MARLALARLRGLLLLAAITLALLATGFAHHAPSAADQLVQEWALAGADVSGFCGDVDADGRSGMDCPACHIASHAALPDGPSTARAADLVFVASVDAAGASRLPAAVQDPSHPLRGPPRA